MTRIQAAPQSILLEQLKLLFNVLPHGVLANLCCVLLAIFLFNNAVPSPQLYTWAALLLFLTLFRWLHYRRYLHVRDNITQSLNLWSQFRILSFILAGAFGSAGFLLFVEGDLIAQLNLCLLIICMAAFIVTAISPNAELVVTFLLLQTAPLILTLYLNHSDVGAYLIWLMAIMLALMLLSALRINRAIIRSIVLSIEAGEREKQLHNYQERLSHYINETPLAVIEWNCNLEVIQWNPAAVSLFGYNATEATGQFLPALILPKTEQDQLWQAWAQLENDAGGHQFILSSRRQNGTLIHGEWFNTTLHDQSGKMIGVMSLIQDVTQRLENERLKEEFVSIVSHELRTPVTSIKGSLALLASGVMDDDSDSGREMLDIALQNTERLHLLINDILDVDKLESGHMEYRFREADLVQLLMDVIRANSSYAEKFDIKVATSGFPEQLIVYMDPDRMNQVLTNLLSNAIKFSENSGKVTVLLDTETDKVRIGINNFGEVIEDSARERLFSKFFQRDSSTTRSREGSGLGLYICKKILERHGSGLDYVSTREKGTTFFFSLNIQP